MQTFVFAIHGARSRAFRAKKVGSGGVWFIEPEADAREKKKEREKQSERERGGCPRRREVIIGLNSRIFRRDRNRRKCQEPTRFATI